MRSSGFCTLVSMLIVGFLSGWAIFRPIFAEGGRFELASANSGVDDVGNDLVPAPMPEWFKFQPSDTVNGWINSLDNRAITGHAWELWGALTALTEQVHNGEKLPVYETWWSVQEALAPPSATRAALLRTRNVLQLETPKQFQRANAAFRSARPPSSLFSGVKYNDSIKRLIELRKYNDGKELARINAGWGTTKPIAERKIQDFEHDAVMLKPVYRLIPAKSVSLLSYWSGPSNSTNPSVPVPTTWTKKMLVIPPNLNIEAKTLKMQDSDEILPAVPLSAFYSIRLTKEDAAALSPKANEGDYVILVAMHVSSREIDNWTWQTFWWSLEKPDLPENAKNHIKAPFDHYQAAVGYSFMTAPNNPDSLTLTCFNPYLETAFGDADFVYTPGQRGIESNCMSCHRTAAWPGPDQRYAGNGVIDPADPAIFGGKSKTDFLWGIADRVVVPPSPPPEPTP